MICTNDLLFVLACFTFIVAINGNDDMRTSTIHRPNLYHLLSNESINNRKLLLNNRPMITPPLPLFDKIDLQLENGAKLWQQSMNASSMARWDINNESGEKTLENAHSEPLKSIIPKDVAVTETNLDYDDEENMAGSTKAPPCASSGKHYCSYRENYPIETVSRIMKFYKYPLESMFKDMQQQVMPTLAKDNVGGLVCDTTTQLVRVGWAMNTNGRWLVVLNTEQYQQYVTEVICRNRSGSSCNFVPPCYRSKCLQRYNTQKLLVVDPAVPHKGPFLSEFIFPSCCVCHVDPDKTFLADEAKRRSN